MKESKTDPGWYLPEVFAFQTSTDIPGIDHFPRDTFKFTRIFGPFGDIFFPRMNDKMSVSINRPHRLECLTLLTLTLKDVTVPVTLHTRSPRLEVRLQACSTYTCPPVMLTCKFLHISFCGPCARK